MVTKSVLSCKDTSLGRAKLWAPTRGQVVIAIVLEAVTTVTTVVTTCLKLERIEDGLKMAERWLKDSSPIFWISLLGVNEDSQHFRLPLLTCKVQGIL